MIFSEVSENPADGAVGEFRKARIFRSILNYHWRKLPRVLKRKSKLNTKIPVQNVPDSGAANQSGVKTCPQCKGAGEVQKLTQSLFTQMVRIVPCEYCNGEGHIITDFCPECNGSGLFDDTKTISVNIPAGVTAGNYIPLREQGNFGPRGGVQGDIIVMIHEKIMSISPVKMMILFWRCRYRFHRRLWVQKWKFPRSTVRMICRFPPARSPASYSVCVIRASVIYAVWDEVIRLYGLQSGLRPNWMAKLRRFSKNWPVMKK